MKRNTTIRDRHRNVIARTKPPCALCGDPIDYTLRYPDPDSFTVDHITPVNRGGPDTLDNKQAAHFRCNRAKSDNLPRRVILICGPPGAGKSTLARQTAPTVYDLDDPAWTNNDQFVTALKTVGKDPHADAAVIRSAPTLAQRRDAAHQCQATDIITLNVALDECIRRIRARGRTKPPIDTQIAAARDWWAAYEPGDIRLDQWETARHW